jgi:2-dehydro-3-deoxyphosphogluconate aldolase/(4S)-4-hydroxy-2-oxoglutarate aldolase
LSLADLLRRQAVLPIVEVEEPAVAVALAHVLTDGGLPVMEIALRTPGALAAIEAVRASVPTVEVGAGTVISAAQLEQVVGAGASFAVSPGSSPALLSAAADCPIPFVPGVATATELMRVAEHGIREVKFFPAQGAGGVSTVSAMGAVVASARFLPTGGIDAGSAPAYLALGQVFAVGGSWVCPAALIREGAWDEIAERVLTASNLTNQLDPS